MASPDAEEVASLDVEDDFIEPDGAVPSLAFFASPPSENFTASRTTFADRSRRREAVREGKRERA
jgi:hypothetical protein